METLDVVTAAANPHAGRGLRLICDNGAAVPIIAYTNATGEGDEDEADADEGEVANANVAEGDDDRVRALRGLVLGLRGIRLCLARPELFGAQLRAIYRASKRGPLSIMFPMVARMEDLDAALVHAEEARRAVGADPVDVGIMIEVPSAVAMAPELARRVQFFSIGTNDLTQYVLAAERGNPALAHMADGLHPAVLRLIEMTCRAANRLDRWVGVCGELAGDPVAIPVLVGLGVTELSMNPVAIPGAKQVVRQIDLASVRELASEALSLPDADSVRTLVEGCSEDR